MNVRTQDRDGIVHGIVLEILQNDVAMIQSKEAFQGFLGRVMQQLEAKAVEFFWPQLEQRLREYFERTMTQEYVEMLVTAALRERFLDSLFKPKT